MATTNFINTSVKHAISAPIEELAMVIIWMKPDINTVWEDIDIEAFNET